MKMEYLIIFSESKLVSLIHVHEKIGIVEEYLFGYPRDGSFRFEHSFHEGELKDLFPNACYEAITREDFQLRLLNLKMLLISHI